MSVRHRGVRRARYGSDSVYSPQTYDYHSPGVTLPCEKLLEDKQALAALSSDVRIFHKDKLKE